MTFLRFLFAALLCFAVASCDFLPTGSSGGGNSEEIPVEKIALPGVDRLSIGGTFEVVVRTQEEYEELIDDRYQDRLNEYCNRNYSEERERLERNNPDLLEEEIQQLVNKICVEETPVFEGLEDVEHPEIDFSEHSLLGQDAHASGCSTPDYDVDFTSTDEEYTYHVKVTEYGMCDMAISKNLWILTPKISEDSEVTFKAEYEQQDRKD